MKSTVDWAEIRKEFPALSHWHWFYSSGAGLISRRSHERLTHFLSDLHEQGESDWVEIVKKPLDAFRSEFANFLSAEGPDSIALIHSTSMAMNLLAMMLKQDHPDGGVILCPEDEFPASTLPWAHHGFQVVFVHADNLVESIEQLKEVRGVVSSVVQFSTGLRAELCAVGEACEQRNIPFFVNATQAMGVYPLNVKRLRATALMCDWHKWANGAYGATTLYVNGKFRSTHRPPMLGWMGPMDWTQKIVPTTTDGHLDVTRIERRLDAGVYELGVFSYSPFLAAGAALELIQSIGVEAIAQRVHDLSQIVFERLSALDHIKAISRRDGAVDFRQSINSGLMLFEVPSCENTIRTLRSSFRVRLTPPIFLSRKAIVSGPFLRVAVQYFNNEADIDALTQGLQQTLR